MLESCYNCGVPLEDYFRLLCNKCRDEFEKTKREAAETKEQRDQKAGKGAFNRGCEAYKQGQDIADNPYNVDDPCSASWHTGWWTAADSEERANLNELID